MIFRYIVVVLFSTILVAEQGTIVTQGNIDSNSLDKKTIAFCKHHSIPLHECTKQQALLVNDLLDVPKIPTSADEQPLDAMRNRVLNEACERLKALQQTPGL